MESTNTPAIKAHELKTDPAVFDAVARGAKTHEIRLNDRNFKVGDTLLLRETKDTGWEMATAGVPLVYTGRTETRTVSHIQTGYGLADGWCILSFAATPAIQAVAPILTWQERYEADPWRPVPLLSVRKEGYMQSEIADLRAALAAVPAQQPPKFKLRDQCGGKIIDYAYRRDHHSQRQCEVCGWRAPRELQSLTVCPNDKAAPAAPVAPDLASLPRYAPHFGDIGRLYERPDGDWLKRADVERLLSHSAQAPNDHVSALTDEQIAGIMGWRGPGAYTAATLRKIRDVLAASPKVEPVSEDKRDAERYRWLRDKSEPGICTFYLSVGKAFDGVKFARETVDEAIDAQIATPSPTKEST